MRIAGTKALDSRMAATFAWAYSSDRAVTRSVSRSSAVKAFTVATPVSEFDSVSLSRPTRSRTSA